MQEHFVYILASRPNGSLCVGVTDDLAGAAYKQQDGPVKRFLDRYMVYGLVHFERFETEAEARLREADLKTWAGDRRTQLIESTNPQWLDLSQSVPA